MHVKREELLQVLESVSPGLSRTNIIEQSSCFVFVHKHVIAFNTLVACRQPADIGWEGAVEADPLLDLLRKSTTETVEFESQDGQLNIRSGKKRKAGIFTDKTILLPLKSIEPPQKGSWRQLPKNFLEAVRYVESAASKNENHFALTCIHIAPQFLEAGDSYQIARYKLAMPIKKDILVRQESLKQILSLDVREFAETASWIHFRNPAGLIFSCRRWASEKYDDMTPFLKAQGISVQLPKTLREAISWAEVFSAQNKDNQVIVQLRRNKVRVLGEGSLGFSSEVAQARYTGPDISFTMPPEILLRTLDWNPKCEIRKGCLKLTTGPLTYVTALGTPEANTAEPKENAKAKKAKK